jgi:hypothetical protein
MSGENSFAESLRTTETRTGTPTTLSNTSEVHRFGFLAVGCRFLVRLLYRGREPVMPIPLKRAEMDR